MTPWDPLSALPEGAFIDPAGRNLKEILAIGNQWMTGVCQAIAAAGVRPPLPARRFEAEPLFPERGLDWPEIRRRAGDLIDASMNASHPGFIGHMNSLPSFVSVLGDLVAAAVDNNLLSVETAPAMTRLERDLLGVFGRAFGLGATSSGVLVGGGSIANLQALCVARNVRLGTDRRSLVAAGQKPVILASEQAHVSVQKAAMILGLGPEGVVSIATDSHYRMDPGSLVQTLDRLRREDRAAFCVVATAGTTGTGSIDPLDDIAETARDHGLWLHVDGAYGGALQFSAEHRRLLAGIEHADSIVFNPHKWFFVARNSSMVLFRDGAILEEHFRIPLPYMRSDPELTNVGEISVHGTQHADVLKLWLSLLLFGRVGFEAMITKGFDLADKLVAEIESRLYLTLAARPDTNIVCFRPTVAGSSEADLDTMVLEIQREALAEAAVFLSIQPLRNHLWLRAVPLNPFSADGEVERLMAVVDRRCSRLVRDDASRRPGHRARE